MRNRRSGGGVEHAGRPLLRWGPRLLGLIAVGLLLVGIGVGLRVPDDTTPSYSASEQAQLDAEGRYRSLAASARAVASTTPGADPRIVELLVATAADLEVQADAVALPRPLAPSPDPTIPPGDSSTARAPGAGTAPAAPSNGTTPAAPSSDGPQFLLQLRDSAIASLADAVDADAGPARVLAAAGANQWERALALGAALGVDAGLPVPDRTAAAELEAGTGPFGAAGSSTDVGAGTAGGSDTPPPSSGQASEDPFPSTSGQAPAPADGDAGGECAGVPVGSDADRQALQHARTAGEQARYGYEVAAALLEDRAALLERAAEHGEAADTASDRLAELCETPDPTSAGFTLTPAFRADPLGELRRLEQQHVHLHAGHVATTSPDTRAWAVMALTAAVVRSTDSGATLQPLPGIEGVTPSSVDGGPDTPTPASNLTPAPEPTSRPAEGAATPEEPRG